jgi:hypothetical protein
MDDPRLCPNLFVEKACVLTVTAQCATSTGTLAVEAFPFIHHFLEFSFTIDTGFTLGTISPQLGHVPSKLMFSSQQLKHNIPTSPFLLQTGQVSSLDPFVPSNLMAGDAVLETLDIMLNS